MNFLNTEPAIYFTEAHIEAKKNPAQDLIMHIRLGVDVPVQHPIGKWY